MKTKTIVRITLIVGLIALGSLLGGSVVVEDITDGFLEEAGKGKFLESYDVVKGKAIENSNTFGKIVVALEGV